MARKWQSEHTIGHMSLSSDPNRTESVLRLLRGLARGDDAIALVEAVADLHPRHNTFPGEVFLQLAGSALDLVSVTADEPIAYDGLIEQYLPECRFRGRQNGKIQFAVLAAAARRGGVEADLLGEVICGRPMTSGRTPSLLPLP